MDVLVFDSDLCGPTGAPASINSRSRRRRRCTLVSDLMNRLTWLSSWVLVRYFSKGEGGGGGGKLRWKLYHPPVCCWHRFPPLAHVRRATSREFPIWISIGWFLLLLCSVLFYFIFYFWLSSANRESRNNKNQKGKGKEKEKMKLPEIVALHFGNVPRPWKIRCERKRRRKSNHQVDAKTYRWCTSLIKYYPTYFRHFRFVSMSRTKCNKRLHVKLNFPSIGSKNCPISYRLHGTI